MKDTTTPAIDRKKKLKERFEIEGKGGQTIVIVTEPAESGNK